MIVMIPEKVLSQTENNNKIKTVKISIKLVGPHIMDF